MMPSTTITKEKVIQRKLLSDLYFFTRYFYKETTGKPFIKGRHFQLMSDTLEKVYRHEITRLIINMPPRFGKTEMAVVNFIAKGLALNPEAKFIHTSYSDSLALENSEHIKDLIQSESFNNLFPLKLKQDSKSKKKWYTEQGGGVYATSSGGQVTGFGAGIMKEDEESLSDGISDIESAQGFGGAIIIDDAMKPEDAESATIRKKINDRFYNTILSRVNSPNTPIIVIGQRLHKDDLPGVLLKEQGWHHLNMRAIENGEQLWDFRADLVNEIKRKKPQVFLAQYQQDPEKVENNNKFFYSLNRAKHQVPRRYNIIPNIQLACSFDFNKSPMSVVVGQINHATGERAVIADLRAEADDNRSALQNLCAKIETEIINKGYNKYQLIITGDSTGKHGDADRPLKENRYTSICSYLGISRAQVKVGRSNIRHSASGDLCNDVLHQLPKGFFNFYNGTETLLDEMDESYPDDSGSLNAAKKELGLHSVDAFRYLVYLWFVLLPKCNKFIEYQGVLDGIVHMIKAKNKTD